VTANLRSGNRVATATLGEALQSDWPAPVAAGQRPEIAKVTVTDGGRRNPDTLRFTLMGTPGGQASVQLQGSNPRVLVLEEIRPGEYTVLHRLAAGVRVATNRPLVARLRVGDRVATSSVDNAYQGVSLRGRDDKWCADCGVVEAVNAVEVDGNGKVIGTLAGGALGALLGSQIGKGDGRTAAGVAGAVGGALIGLWQRRHKAPPRTVPRCHASAPSTCVRSSASSPAPTWSSRSGAPAAPSPRCRSTAQRVR
jgi:uncharacterized protein YcfJ